MRYSLDFIQRTKSFFNHQYDYFYLLDLGSYNVKLALLEIDHRNKEGIILRVVEEPMRRIPRITVKKESTAQLNREEKKFDYMITAAQRAIARLQPSRRAKLQKGKLIVGLAAEMVHGHTSSYLHKREKAEDPIEVQEIKQIIQNAELKAYEEVRKKFAAESGYSELDAYLIHPVVQEVKIDGHRVVSPLGLTGKEFYLNIFNAYLPSFYRGVFQELATKMRLNLHSILYEPYVLFNALLKRKGSEFDAVIIDIGGKNTRISLVRKGKLEDARIFSFGGESFTQRISRELSIGFHEADLVKIRYSKNNISGSARVALEKSLERELSFFLSALELILKDFSQINLLPGNIYVYGGGGNLPLIDAIIKKRNWKKDLSFLSPPKFFRIGRDLFETRFASRLSDDAQLISLLALSDYTLQATTQKEDALARTLRRMTNIIQD